jgi:hypothetical protein
VITVGGHWDELTRSLGVEWTPVRKEIAEIVGVPRAVLRAFSRRRADIEASLATSRRQQRQDGPDHPSTNRKGLQKPGLSHGETRTRTGDTTIFSRAVFYV